MSHKIRAERERRIYILDLARDHPDHPLAEPTRVWALGCLAILDQFDAGTGKDRLRSIAERLDAEEVRLGELARAYRDAQS